MQRRQFGAACYGLSHLDLPLLEYFPIKNKKLFPVQRLGMNICADWDLFFLIFVFFPFFPKIVVIFLPKKTKTEKKEFASAQVAMIWVTRYTGNKFFFKGGPTSWYLPITTAW